MSSPIQGETANQSLSLATINGFRIKEDPDGLLGFFFNGIEIGRINQQGDASFAAIGVNAGLGISVVGDTISNTGVVSINSSTGTTSITGGAGITVQGLNIINSGVTGIGTASSPPYATGNVKFLGGTGVSIVNSATTVVIGITSTTGVSSVTSPNDSLTINPSTGAVYAEINEAHANTWQALQTFGNNISIGGAQVNVTSLAAGEVLQYNGTNWINREISSTALSTLNGLSGAVTIASSTNTLTIGTSGQNIEIGVNLANPNLWTGLQTFGNNISFGGAQVQSSTLATGDVLYYNGTNWINTPLGQAGVTSVRSSTGTISVLSSTGAVDIEVNLTHTNTWSALQTFGNNISIGGAQFAVSSLASGQVLYYNGTNWVNETPSSFGVESVDTLKGIISLASPNNSISIGTTGQTINFDINTNNSNDWAGIQSFSGSTTYFTNLVQAGDIFIGNHLYISSTTDIFNTANTWGALQTFGNDISFGGAQVNVTSLTSTDILQYNGTNWINVPESSVGGVKSLDGLTGALTLVAGTGITITNATTSITIDATGSFSSSTAYTWTALQTFADSQGIELNSGSYANYFWLDSQGVVGFFGNEYSTPIIDVGTNVTQQNANSNGLPTPNTSYGGGIFRFDLRTSGNPSTLVGLSSNPQWYVLMQPSGTAGAGTPIFGVDVGGHVSTINNILDDSAGNMTVSSTLTAKHIVSSTMTVTTTTVQDINVNGAFTLSGTIDVPINATLTTNGGSALGVNLGNANTWTALQTFNAGITGSGNTGSLTAGSGILGHANTWTAQQTFSDGLISTLNADAQIGYRFSNFTSFVSWGDNGGTFGAFLNENYNSANIGVINKSSGGYGGIPADTYTIGLKVTGSGAVYTGSANTANIGTNHDINARNTLDDGSGNMDISGNLTFNGVLTANNHARQMKSAGATGTASVTVTWGGSGLGGVVTAIANVTSTPAVNMSSGGTKLIDSYTYGSWTVATYQVMATASSVTISVSAGGYNHLFVDIIGF